MFGRLSNNARQALTVTAQQTAAAGQEHALQALDTLIYNTPRRGGYVRTGRLFDQTYTRVFTDQPGAAGEGRAVIEIGNRAPYAPYVEHGTYFNYRDIDAIVNDAENRNSDPIVLRYLQRRPGVEPRPFIYPSVVLMQRVALQIFEREIERRGLK